MAKRGGRWTRARRERQSRTIKEFWRLHPERLGTRGPRSAAFRAMKSEQTKRLWADPAYRARAALWTRERRYALSLRRVSEETRARMSASAKARWARRRAGASQDPGPQGLDAPEPVPRVAEAVQEVQQ